MSIIFKPKILLGFFKKRLQENSLFTKSLIALLFIHPFLFLSGAYSQSANLDQVRNGSAAAPISPATWVNGNAGPTNAHYAEGYSIPYRMHITGLSSGSHVLVIEWDTKDQNGHAIDYITHYDNMDNPVGSHMATFGHAPEVIDPTLGIAGLGAATTFDIPAPSSAGSEVAGQPTNSFNALDASLRKMTIYGGTITNMSYVFEEAQDATTGSTQTRLSITFSTTNSQVLLAWGGHIAAEYDWGAGRGATGVNGSPYHTRLISLDGKGGNQDRSLKADAVVIPPPLCGISPAQFACPETSSLTFDATGSSTGLGISYEWTLTNGTPSAGAMINGSNTGFSVEVVPIGADFLAGGTFNLSLTVHKTGAESTTCNLSPAGTIVNVIVTASADPTVIDITSAAHSTTLTADIGAGSTDPNNANYNYQWSIVTLGTAGVLSNATSRIATYTAGLLDAGSTIEFKVIATQKSAPNCSDEATVSINVGSIGACDVTPQGPVCEGAVTTHNGSPDPKPATATYTWVLSGYGGAGTTSSTFASANGTTSIQVNATESYRITLNQVYDNPDANTSCFEDVIVNAIDPGVIAGNQTLCTPFDPVAFTSTTDATGTGDITYQWQISTTSCAAGFADIPGANNAIYDAPAVTQVTYYRRVATSTVNGVPCSDFSNCLTVTPNDTDPGVINNAQTICVGEDPAALTNVTPATGDGNISYQWQVSTTDCSSGFADIPGATDATFDPGPLTVTTYYRRTATSTLNGVTCSGNSNCIEITVIDCVDHIFPTGTECADFTGQTVPPLESMCFRQSGGFVTNASSPGAWFYYTNVTKPAGATQITVRVNQSNDGVISGLFTTSEIKAWTSTCTQITGGVTTNYSNPSVPEITIAGLTNAEQTIIVSVKYNSKSIVGSAVSGTSSVYSFDASYKTNGVFAPVSGSSESITAQDCSVTTSTPGNDVWSEVVMPTELKIAAYPNPFNHTVNFNFVTPVSGKASLEIYDLIGRRLAVVFEGNVDAGMQKNISYQVPAVHRVPMIYKLSVGDKTTYGKMLPGTE